MPSKSRGTNQSVNASNSTLANGRDIPIKRGLLSDPTIDSLKDNEQPYSHLPDTESTANPTEPPQPILETNQDLTEGGSSKEEILLSCYKEAIKLAEAWKELAQPLPSASIVTPSPNDTLRIRAQKFRDANILLSSVPALRISKHDSRRVKVHKWAKFRMAFFARLKEVQTNTIDATAILKTRLPDNIRYIIEPANDVKNPHELAQRVEDIIVGVPDSSMVTTDNLVDLLVNKLPTSAETLNTLNLWRMFDPRNEDPAFIWCKFSMYLLPESSQYDICDWPEYINNDYQSVWNRIMSTFPDEVTNREHSNFRRRNQCVVAENIEDESSRKRPRTKGRTSSSRYPKYFSKKGR